MTEPKPKRKFKKKDTLPRKPKNRQWPPEKIKEVGEHIRAGILSYEEIRDRTDVPVVTQRSWKKRYCWHADLAVRVREATERKIAAAWDMDEEKVIEEASNEQFLIVSGHKKALKRAREMIDSALHAIPDVLPINKAGEEAGGVDEALKIIAATINAAVTASGGLKHIIPLERQCYKIDDDKNAATIDDLIRLLNQDPAEDVP